MNFTAAYKRKRVYQGVLFVLAAWLALGAVNAAAASQGTTLTVRLKGMATDDGVNWRSLPIGGRFTVQTSDGKPLGLVRANPTQEQRAEGECDTLVLPDGVASVVLTPVEEDFQGGFVCPWQTVVNIVPGEANAAINQAFARQGLFALRCTAQDGGVLVGEAEFMVLDEEGNPRQSFVTGEDGAYTAQKALPAGEYRLVQLRSAEGTLSNPDPQAFFITPYFGNPSDIAQISVVNRPVATHDGDSAPVPGEETHSGVEPEATTALVGRGVNLGAGYAVAAVSATDRVDAVTREDGSFILEGLAAGDYSLYAPLPEGMVPGTDSPWQVTQGGDMVWMPITVEAGRFYDLPEISLVVSAGVHGAAHSDENGDIALSQPAALAFSAFDDTNKDGLRGKYERPIPGVMIEVLGDDGAVLASGTTDNLGEALVTDIPPGSRPLRLTLPPGYAYTVKGQGQGVDVSCAAGDTGEALSDLLSFTGGQVTGAGVGAVPVGSFSGRVWMDVNNNGVMDPDEPGVAGILLTLKGVKTRAERTVVTGETGEYLFEGLPSDSYILSAELPEGLLFARYTQTGGDLRSVFTVSGTGKASRQFDVSGAKNVRNKNVGVIIAGTVRGTAFLDLNYNGLMDEGEPGCPKVTVELSKASNGDVVGRMTTGDDGAYFFGNLRGGEYRLRAILPDNGSIFTKVRGASAGEEEPVPSLVDAGSNLFVQRSGRRESTIGPIVIGNGGAAATVVGVALGADIKGTVFMDKDYLGVLSGKQQKISGVRVELRDEAGNPVDTTTTNANGNYTLAGVMPGSYCLAFLRKEGHAFTRFRPGEAGGNHVKALVGNFGLTEPIAVAMGQRIDGVNAGMLRSSTVEGVFFDDLNDNGLQDPGEAGMEGVTVRLLSQDGEIDLTAPVGEDGGYFFDGVMPVAYTLTYNLPEHVELAKTAEGGNTLQGEGRSPVTEAFTVEAGTRVVRGPVGGVRLGSFEGFLFHDVNASGVQDPGEEAGRGLTLAFISDRADLEEVTAEADSSGRFSVTGLRPAAYRLALGLPEGFIFS
ncbi:MAG: carboxypeptidase regulatory-like domain-containing protein, partial [Clostridia bacterium]|nr:carboxypeptidase regulatory-like domain-containing protein [Clostridia bacterium]